MKTPKKQVSLFILLILLILVAIPSIAFGQTGGEDATVLAIDSPNIIPGEYIVVYEDAVTVQSAASTTQDIVSSYGGEVIYIYETAVNGFAATLSDEAVNDLLQNPDVKFVEANQQVSIAQQSNATWGIDRIDQRNLPLNSTYNYDYTGAGVHAYIIDTGLRATHNEFTGRVGNGFDSVGGGTNDCNGHGTHVAGTIGGTTYGVAKDVTIHAVRVLDCQGSGSTAGIVAGTDWVVANVQLPAVANLSLGGGASNAMDQGVQSMIDAGVTSVLAAGNDNANACNTSPARLPAAITTGSTTSSDARSSFSNYGTCLDIFAPGSSVTSAWNTSDSATNSISGTSMASPHVAGVVALYLEQNGGGSPAEVTNAILGAATENVISNPGSGSPNLFLYSFITPPGPTPTPTNTPTPIPGVVFFDDFETSQGWSTNPNNSDTATTGQWEVGNPESTDSDGPKQLGNTVSGSNDLVTGRLAGFSEGDYDVDNGVTSVRSPNIIIPANTNVTLSLDYYFAHTFNSSADDYLRIKVVGNSTTTVLEELGAADNDNGVWQSFNANLDNYAGQTVYLLIEAADAASGSIVEAGVDDVRVVALGSTTPTATPSPTNTPPPPTTTPPPGCSAPSWVRGQIYNDGDVVAHNDHEWEAIVYSIEPGTTGQWGEWQDLGSCGGTPTPTPTAVPGCTVYTSADIPQDLPIGQASVSSTLNVSGSDAIADLNVNVDMSHSWTGDLSFVLTHQDSGTSVTIIDRPGNPADSWGCTNDDILATLDDEAAAAVEEQCATTSPAIDGTFSPNNALAAFDGESGDGTWILEVSDAYASADAGTLNNWGIEVCTP